MCRQSESLSHWWKAGCLSAMRTRNKRLPPWGGWSPQLACPDHSGFEDISAIMLCTYQTFNKAFISCFGICVPKKQEEMEGRWEKISKHVGKKMKTLSLQRFNLGKGTEGNFNPQTPFHSGHLFWVYASGSQPQRHIRIPWKVRYLFIY